MPQRHSAWFRRLMALAELAGDYDQQAIVERMGVSPSAVTKWKTHGTEPSPDAVRAAAKAYHEFVGEDTDELLFELLQIAYMSEPVEPRKPRTPRRRRLRHW